MSAPSLIDKAETAADVDLSVLKVFLFIAFVVVLAGISGYFIATVSPLFGSISLLLFWIAFSLQVFFIKDWSRIIVAVLLESLAIATPTAVIYWANISIYLAAAFFAFFGMLIAAESFGKTSMNNSLKIPFWAMTRGVLGRIIPGTLIFMAIIYLFVAGQSIVQKNGRTFSENILVPVVRLFIPNFSSEGSLGDLITEIAKRTLATSEFASLPAHQQNELVDRVEKQIIANIGNIDTKASLGTAIYDFFKEKLDASQTKAKIYLLLGLITFLWFLVKTIAFIIYLPISFLIFVVYELLIVMNFAVVQYESRSREIILLK